MQSSKKDSIHCKVKSVVVVYVLADTFAGELQLSKCEYSALEHRHKRLERQHRELQDLASVYSEIIRGFSAIDSQAVSVDQLQAEAGREGLRVKALEAELLKPIIREVGSLQALISQTNTMRTLIDMLNPTQHSKAGGLRELESFVSDLRTIRDTLNRTRDSRGLVGLAAEVQDLIYSKQKLSELASEVGGPSGLREKASKYERLTKAFTDVQNTSTLQRPVASKAFANGENTSTLHRPAASKATMNPARALMISATPLESDPDRDLYEPPPPVAKSNQRTGPNSTPLGTCQDQPPDSSLKRKPKTSATGESAKRPRVNIDRASALVQSSLPLTVAVKARTQAADSQIAEPFLDLSNNTNKEGQASSHKARPGSSQPESGSRTIESGGPGTQVHAASMPDWKHANARSVDVGFAPAAGALRYPSPPPGPDVESHTDISLRPVRFTPVSSQKSRDSGGAWTALQAVAAAQADPHLNPTTIWTDYLRHAIAVWIGFPDASAAWDVSPLCGLKKNPQIPGDLLAYLTERLSRLIPRSKYSTYETLAPSHNSCILR